MIKKSQTIEDDFNGLRIFAVQKKMFNGTIGMPQREMDEIIYPVCKLCRDHERSGFVEGIKTGVRLEQKLGNK